MNFAEIASTLGNLGEFIGSIAVLITLIYLAVQVRSTKIALLSTARDERASRALDLFLTTASSEVLLDCVVKDLEKSGVAPRGFVKKQMERGLSRTDAERLRYFYSAWNRHYETLWRSPLSEDERSSVERNIRYTFSSPSGKDFWDMTASRTTGTEYSNFVSSVLSNNAS